MSDESQDAFFRQVIAAGRQHGLELEEVPQGQEIPARRYVLSHVAEDGLAVFVSKCPQLQERKQ